MNVQNVKPAIMYLLLVACVAAMIVMSVRSCSKPQPAAPRPVSAPLIDALTNRIRRAPPPQPQPVLPPATNAAPERDLRDVPDTPNVILPPGNPCPDDDFSVYINAALQALRKNLSEEEKVAAMRKIEMLVDPMVMPVVLEALSDPSIEVRQLAIESMRPLDDPCVVPGALKALDDEDRGIRADAVECLLRVRDATANEALIKALGDSDHDVRESVFDLLEHQENPALLPTVAKALQTPDAGMQQSAVNVLEDVCDPHAVDLIIQGGLLSTYDTVRAESRAALQRLSGKSFPSYEQWRQWWDTQRSGCPADNARASWDAWWQALKKQ